MALFQANAEARARYPGFEQHEHRQRRQTAWLNALVTPVLRGSVIASVAF